MKENKSRISAVRETNLGMYVWQLPDGTFLADGPNVLNIESMYGDIVRIANLAAAARNVGFSEGEAVFLPGRRRVTDWELDDQIQRSVQGLVPDPLDIGVYKDATKRGY